MIPEKHGIRERGSCSSPDSVRCLHWGQGQEGPSGAEIQEGVSGLELGSRRRSAPRGLPASAGLRSSVSPWPSLQRQPVCRETELSHFRLRPARSPPASAFSFLEKLRLNPDTPAQLHPASEPLPTGEQTAHSPHNFTRGRCHREGTLNPRGLCR